MDDKTDRDQLNSLPVDSIRHSRESLNDLNESGPIGKKMKPSDVAEYDELISQLAHDLKIARHPDTLTTLRAIRLVLENKLTNNGNRGVSNESGCNAIKDATEIRIQKNKFRLDDVSLPKALLMRQKQSSNELNQNKSYAMASKESMTVDSLSASKDEPLKRAARALKLLYLYDQKQLQNQVNKTISSIQSITANPKTDPRLISIGR